MTSVGELKKDALQSAAYDTILQILLRVVSFILNSVVVRTVGPATLAVCSVRLLLLYSTTLLLTREAFRRAALAAKQHQINGRLINLVWMSWLLVFPVGGVLCYVWCSMMTAPPVSVLNNTSHYYYGVLVMLLCCAVELAAEVPFVLAEQALWTRTRVVIEGITQLVRSVLVASVVTIAPSVAILGYCVCHLVGSCVFTLLYYGVFYVTLNKKDRSARGLPITAMRQLLPSRERGHWLPSVEREVGGVAKGFYLQCWLKELLTEGEWFLMNLLPLVSLTQQGTYQVVSNLGALGARLVFRSIETAAYKFFARTIVRGQPLEAQDQKKVKEFSDFLHGLLRGLSILSLTIVCFGWSYCHALLQMYGGSSLSSSGTSLLRAQCLLLVLLALNGVTEAYTFAAMSQQQLHRHSALLVVFSICYLSLAAGFSYLFGAIGFVAANAANMALRIVHGWVMIEQQYRNRSSSPLSAVVLPPAVLLPFAATFVFCCVSEAVLYPVSLLLHVAAGGCAMLVLLFVLRHECRPIYTTVLHKLDDAFHSYNNKRRLTSNESEQNECDIFKNNVVSKIHTALYTNIPKVKEKLK